MPAPHMPCPYTCLPTYLMPTYQPLSLTLSSTTTLSSNQRRNSGIEKLVYGYTHKKYKRKKKVRTAVSVDTPRELVVEVEIARECTATEAFPVYLNSARTPQGR